MNSTPRRRPGTPYARQAIPQKARRPFFEPLTSTQKLALAGLAGVALAAVYMLAVCYLFLPIP